MRAECLCRSSAVGLLVAVCTIAWAEKRRIDWDPPAIRAFPDHDAVAADPHLVPRLIEQGEDLFRAEFNDADGAGRPEATGDSKPTPRDRRNNVDLIRTSGPDALSCLSCHNQPRAGGSGDFAANVFVGAHFADPPTRRIDSETTNERNTTSIRGAGLVEIAAREMTRELWSRRDAALRRARDSGKPERVALSAKGISFGALVARPDGTVSTAELEGVDYDLVVRPFGVKGIAASLREFTIGALNQHHGIQAIERFGWERTGLRDFDGDGVEIEFTVGQVTALVVFQAQLTAPVQAVSADPGLQWIEERGRQLFASIKCDSCHVPELPLESLVFSEPSESNRPGALTPEMVRAPVRVDLSAANGHRNVLAAYTDLKRHDLCDEDVSHYCNETRKQDNVDTKLFLTAKLWDVATSAPYGHRGDLRTISSAVVRHGGEARAQRDQFLRLDEADKRAVIAFLRSLGRDPSLR